MQEVISEGKTTNEAIENGLKILNVKRNMVDVKVLEEEKKSFFSILTPRVVKVKLTVREQNVEKVRTEVKRKENQNQDEINTAKERIDNFLQKFISEQPVKDLQYEIKQEKFDLEVIINGDKNEISYLIGYRGETLNALQTLISSIANKNLAEKVRVHVDVNGYREKREQILKDLAFKVSKTVLRTGKAITLEPMVAYERKIIHSALQDNNKITTYSKGEEPHRRIVVDLKK